MSEFAQQRPLFTETTRRLLLGLMLTGMAGLASANKPDDISEAEMKLLPPYCIDTMGFGYGDASFNTSPRAGHWVALMGRSFWAMHHYCWAQINMNRSRRAGIPSQTRKAIWESVRGDYGYVLKNATSDFIMLPEIYTRIGEVELLLAHPDKAGEAFARARQQKPDYWPAYSHWAEFLMKIGRRPEAMKIVISGLENAPGSKVLLEQYRVLGGKMSDLPKPIEKPQTEVDPAANETEPAMQKNTPAADANDEQK